jgi:hypothetical protein
MATTTDLVGQQTEQLPAPSSTSQDVTPIRAGSVGAALGLGVGLLFGEFVVAGVVIGAAAVLGMAAMRSTVAKAVKA